MALLLVDVDGTLTKGLSSYQLLMQDVIYKVFHKKPVWDIGKYHGSTDRLIFQDVLRTNNIPFTSESLETCLQTFGTMYFDFSKGLSVIPGVLETVPYLSERNILGLLTGNVESNAREKLSLFELNGRTLNDYFPFGGFGNDPHKKRSDLVTLAIKRARENHHWKGNGNSTYVIGDTPRDVEAANEAGVKIIAVTTGKYTRQDLLNAGAKNIIDNFKEIPYLIQ